MKTIRCLFIAFALFTSFYRANAATVFPIATNAVCNGIATSGTNYLVGFLSGTNVCAQLVSTNGSLLGSVITNGVSKGFPFVTKGGANYFEVWFNDYTTNTVGQIMSSSGVKIGSAFSLGTNRVYGLASDGTNFLVVLNDKSQTRFFYGQLVTAAGTLSGSIFLISSQTANGAASAVAFGKTNYLVIYSSQNLPNQGNTNLTYGVFVSPSGAASSPVQLGQTVAPDQSFLAVAFDGTNYLATWQWDPYPETFMNVTNWEIFGRLVSQTGTLIGNELQLVTDAGNNQTPSLAFDGFNYLLAWGYGYNVTTNANIRFQFLDRSANAVGSRLTLFTAQGTNTPLLALNGLIFDGTRYAMAATFGLGLSNNFSSDLVYGGFIPRLPTLTASNYVGTQFSLKLTGSPGFNYTILMTTNLGLANWTAIVTNSPTNGTFTFTDTSATNKNRFYRALSQ